MKAILTIAVVVAAMALAGPASAADKYVPGVTDFPSAPQQSERYVPGVTDFPSYGPTSEARTYVSDGFDWLDAGFGAAIGIAFGAVAGVSLILLRRRTGLSTA
jgi:hypothetical protein